MNRPVARYRRSPVYGWLAVTAAAGSAFSGWLGHSSVYCYIPCVLFAATALGLLWLASRPQIEIYETHLAVGRKAIPWSEITAVEFAGWLIPLAVRIRCGSRQSLIIYPGDRVTCGELLNCLRRSAKLALIEGVPYSQFWGETIRTAEPAEPELGPLPRPRLLLPEDEREIEEMYQRLKAEREIGTKGEPHGDSQGAREQ